MSDICTYNRFELIAKYKAKLIEATNIETSADEMAVIDNILFRVWQMGWLDRLEQPTVDAVPVVRCSECVHFAEWTAYEKTQFGVTRDGGCKYWNWISTNKNGFCYQGVRITDGYCADGERKDGADDGRTD